MDNNFPGPVKEVQTDFADQPGIQQHLPDEVYSEKVITKAGMETKLNPDLFNL